ncbi:MULTISPECIES: nucleotide exchange factor GrpE [Legionella]|uniref:nucleotide exchange factor GrpE n=1 Tax=Legionella TaxID=445 RepID=UPI000F8E93B5|nr:MULTISPECIES: nucleotide exchange factor GrpE [Legionella]MCP0913143.1 nucleotide exchange factor GrpE [Legionella sp. 27cVA30]RUR02472.1 nucleotide exchange factor GrpE [Legionella septentrionalis]RUR10641.1 nucleotide exchange factor GrpE [Legionella septentrionalis]
MSKKTTKDWEKIREDLREENDLLAEDESAEVASKAEAGSLEHPSYQELEEKLTLAEKQAHENWEKSVRAMAELDNIQRRAQRDVENAHRYGLEKFISSLLPVLDSLGQALQLAEQDKAMLEGLQLTMKLFLDVLKKHGVEEINPEGLPFDPQLHEAMAMQEAPDVAANTVLTVFQKGYKLNDRVIRPARVIVAKG